MQLFNVKFIYRRDFPLEIDGAQIEFEHKMLAVNDFALFLIAF